MKFRFWSNCDGDLRSKPVCAYISRTCSKRLSCKWDQKRGRICRSVSTRPALGLPDSHTEFASEALRDDFLRVCDELHRHHTQGTLNLVRDGEEGMGCPRPAHVVHSPEHEALRIDSRSAYVRILKRPGQRRLWSLRIALRESFRLLKLTKSPIQSPHMSGNAIANLGLSFVNQKEYNRHSDASRWNELN